jgi:hypothetical protein
MRFIIFLACTGGLFAQGSGSISGTITDPSGATISGARVNITSAATGASRQVSTNENGAYTLTPLPPGAYRLEIEASGFQKYAQSGLVLQVDERLRVDVTMKVGALSEVVEVNAQATVVNTQDAVLRNVVDTKRMVDLPLNGRNALQLVVLTPGVLPVRQDVGGSFQPADQVSVSVSGSRSNGLNYILDGGDNMDTYRSVANAFPNPDLLQEFSVQTNSYSAEFGGRAGGVVNAVTKSGTNEFHGTGFEFLRNYKLNARNFFAPTHDGLKRNQYGGTFGGPVWIPKVYDGRNKTFFFGGAQQTPVRSVPTTATARVLTAGQRQGNFSDLRDGRGNPVIIRDPDTREPFPNNTIPASRLDPVFQNLLKVVPVAGDPTGLVRFGRQNLSDNMEYSIRGDHIFNDRNRIFGRFFREENSNPNLGFEGNILSYTNSLIQRATNTGLTYTRVFRPSVIGEFAFNFNRSDGLRGEVTPFTWRDLGSNVPSAGSSKDLLLNSVGGYFSVILFGDTPLVRNNFQYKGSMSWLKGKHNLKFGFDFIRRQFNIPIVNSQFHGTFNFASALTGDNAADAVLGRPSAFGQSDGFRVALRQTDYVVFVQDDVKLSSRLTVNLGLRWEPFRPWLDTWTTIPQIAEFRPGTQSKVYPNATPGLLLYGDPGVTANLARIENNRLSPRIGIAFDPVGDGKTSLRAGYGIFYDALLPTEQVQQYATDVPAFPTVVNFSFPASTRDPYAGRPVPFPAPIPKPKDYVFPTPVTLRMFAADFTNPYTQQWNFTFERQVFGPAAVMRATYQGSKGTRLAVNTQENPARYIPGQSTRANVEQRRIYAPQYGSIRTGRSVGNSTYHAMVLTFEKRFSRAWSVLASYTWSKTIDSGINVGSANQGVINNPYDYNSDHGLADADRPHAAVVSYLWDLPKLTGWNPVLRHVIGGWQNNGIFSAYSGLTLSPISGIDNSLSGTGSDRPDLVGDTSMPGGRTRAEQINKWFNTAAFVLNREGTFGNAGRNILRGPGLWNFDWGLFKQIPVVEGHNLQFRAEFFNLFNHTTLGLPNNNLQSAAFGRITGAGSPRIIQFALKYVF